MEGCASINYQEGGVPTVFFFHQNKPKMIGLSSMFLQHWSLHNIKSCLCFLIDPPPTFTSYIHGSWTMTKQYGLKLRSYLEHLREDSGVHFENLMGMHWEQVNSPLPSPPPKPKRKTLSLSWALTCWALTLARMRFVFLVSPFSTWANIPIINWGYLVYSLQEISNRKRSCEAEG